MWIGVVDNFALHVVGTQNGMYGGERFRPISLDCVVN